MKAVQYLSICVAVFFTTQACMAQQDAKGCKDSPLISRFPGSWIKSCTDKADEVHSFMMGSGKPDNKLEGEYHELDYGAPQASTRAQVTRNILTALQTAGYSIDNNSGDGDITAHLGKTWIQEEIGSGRYSQYVLIETQLTQDVVANAAALSGGLASTGHTVVKGILFDTGKAAVKPESDPALKEVAKLLTQDAKLKLYVVGHTDNTGILAANVTLSQQRAAAVVQVLIAQYGVAAGRLQAYGNGPYAPLASNDSEDGRALNRRVELVKQ
jgi:outer membrane protein OmpA-like peptidoglycan-associated protein